MSASVRKSLVVPVTSLTGGPQALVDRLLRADSTPDQREGVTAHPGERAGARIAQPHVGASCDVVGLGERLLCLTRV